MKWANNSMLNRPGQHSVAAISAQLSSHISGKNNPTFELAGEIDISDCTRSISLACYATVRADAAGLEDFENIGYKLDTLISILSEAKRNYNIAKKELKTWLKEQ